MRTWGFRLVALLSGLVLGLAIAEMVARTAVAHITARRPLDEGLPVLQEPDPELGWRNKAGRAVWPGQGEDGGKDITMTFWPGGLRATGPTLNPTRPEVVPGFKAIASCADCRGNTAQTGVTTGSRARHSLDHAGACFAEG